MISDLRLRDLAAPARTALVVGTVLCIVNETFSQGSPARIAMNYVVPFLVASYSRLSLLRGIRAREAKSRCGRDSAGE